MARVKLSEYRAKSLLVDDYKGYSLLIGSDTNDLPDEYLYAVKVDQGIKKRGRQGLLKLGVAKSEVTTAVHELTERGYSRFLAEPMAPHDETEEKYVSFERVRGGIQVLYSQHGGIDVEEASDIREFLLPRDVESLPFSADFAKHVMDVMNDEQLSFVEMNPLLIVDGRCIPLDAAVLADSAGYFLASWDETDIVEPRQLSESENAIAELNRNSTAAFSLRILNPDGAIWLVLSGGGASITIADEAMNMGKAALVGNYGEYSGGPTTEESMLYTRQVLSDLLASKAPRKALVIAGGVANFTDVKKTFTGVIAALKEKEVELRGAGIKVYVRRGGPNEAEGLAAMKHYLELSNLYGSVHGSNIVLTEVIHEAVEYVDA